MILRNSFVRHGRQPALSTQSRRALATDHRQPFNLPTATAEPPPPDAPSTSAAPGHGDDAADSDQPAADKPLWRHPTVSPLARWNRRREIKLDKRPVLAHQIAQRLAKTTGRLGGAVHTRFAPASLLRDPPRPADVTLELLMAAQCHMGHHRRLWNPAMQRYIYGVRANIHVISLEETAAALRRAAKVVEQVAYLGGLLLFVGNRKGQMEVIARAAELAGACHLFTKWVPGTITNRDVILGKEQLKIVDHQDKPVKGFERHLLERRPVMPDLVVVMNPLENYTLLHECAQENIPTIGLVDTNGDPTKVTYTIPGNDDSLRAVSVIAGVLGRAGEAGQQRRKKDAARGLCTWRNPPEIALWIDQNLSTFNTPEAVGAKEGRPEDGKVGHGVKKQDASPSDFSEIMADWAKNGPKPKRKGASYAGDAGQKAKLGDVAPIDNAVKDLDLDTLLDLDDDKLLGQALDKDTR